jgi:serine/threonine-protein kinase
MTPADTSFKGPWLCPKCRSRFDDHPGRCPHDGKHVVADLTGRVVGGRYTLKELLGIGGMDSSVWLAIQTNIDRQVAIKLLPESSKESSERFARGARIASKLNHPNITVVHDYGSTEDGHLFLVMERLEGHTLQTVVKRGPLPLDRAVHIADQILRALDHAHKRQIVHRDIKPANIYLSPRNEDTDYVKVLDFGIARFIDDPDGISVDHDDEITTARQVCGTPQYMAPEQVASGPVDQRTDLYALGVVFYRLITGRLPFLEKDHTALFMHHLHSTPPSFDEVRPDLGCPPELEDVVMRALAKHPDERYASAAEMRRALKQVRRRLGIAPVEFEDSISSSRSAAAMSMTQTSADIQSRHWLVPMLFLLVLALGAVVFLLQRAQEAPASSIFADSSVAHSAPSAPATLAPSSAAPSVAVVPSAAPADAAAPATEAVPPSAAVPSAAVPSATAADAAQPMRATVQLKSTPTGVRVSQAGRALGTTPLTLQLPEGTHRLTFSKRGYAHSIQLIDVGANGDKIQRMVQLKRRAARTRPPARPATAEAPIVAAPTSTPPAAPATQASKQVRMRLLDEDEARTFDVGQEPAKQPASAATKPKIDLLQ